MRKFFLLSAILLPVCTAAPVIAEEPPLPFGLGSGATSSEPVLPAGLEDTGISNMQADTADDLIAEKKRSFDLPFRFTGFIETRAGMRLHDQNFEKSASIGETRLQLQAEKFWDNISTRVTADFIADPVADRWAIDLDNGDGWIDLREAFISWRATDFMDIKAGRQILTWGTGDLVFLNDLFPKDFDSFFIGRNEEYLKAPSDALKTSFFSSIANLDVIYTPNFDSDRFSDGARISTFNPFTGGQTSRGAVLMTDPRGKYFTEDEWAARLYRNFGAYETALYGYDGYWKNPQGLDVPNTRATFPRLSVYGASIRGPVYKGIGNLESAYYDSRDDSSGRNPVLPNSQFRFLMGYEQEVATELTAGVQYNLEHITDYRNLIAAAAPGSPVPDENRHIFTLRLTKFMMNQNVKLSLFNFLAPGDSDGYTRGNIHWKLTDQWAAEAGGNIFYGESRNTFFGQLEDNTNLYISLRYSF